MSGYLTHDRITDRNGYKGGESEIKDNMGTLVFDGWVPITCSNQGQKWVFAEQVQHGCMEFKDVWLPSTRSNQG